MAAKRLQLLLEIGFKSATKTSYFGKWTVNFNLAYRDRFLLTKTPDKTVYKTVVLSDLGLTVYYPKQHVLGSTFPAAGSNEIGPRFVKTGAEWASWLV